MAKHIFYDPSITVNSVDLSAHTKRISFVVTIVGQPASAVNDLEDYEMPGLRKVSPITVDFYQDFAASKTYATLNGLWTNRTSFNVVIKNSSGAVSATNPSFTVSCFISSFPIVAGTHGESHMSQCVFAPAGALTIATS